MIPAKYSISTTRFNNQTLNENISWRKNNKFNGCIYNSPIKLPHNTPKHSVIFIIEMNNDSNKIIGFGIIKNKLDYNYCRIYNNNNYNRFTYKSDYYIPIHDINHIYLHIIQSIEKILFTGKSHLKRGQGITSFPHKFQQNQTLVSLLKIHQFDNLIGFFRQIFTKRFKQIRV